MHDLSLYTRCQKNKIKRLNSPLVWKFRKQLKKSFKASIFNIDQLQIHEFYINKKSAEKASRII